MELLNCSLKDKSIEYISRLILDKLIDLDIFLQLLDDNPDWIEDNISGEITYSTLSEIIEVGYTDQKYGMFLTYIIELIEGCIIDDFMFDKIVFYPYNDIKEKMLISLAHKSLKENQLCRLCDLEISFECYFELAILYYTESEYQLETLKRFIGRVLESRYSYIIKELVMELKEHHVTSSKIKYEYIIGKVKNVNKKVLGIY